MKVRKTLNRPLLRKLALKLRNLRHEKHFNQEEFIAQTKCGTAACIAGWTLLITKTKHVPGHGLFTAERLLGLRDNRPFYEIHWLFNPSPSYAWPSPYKERWDEGMRGRGKERPSRIAADLLDALADGTVKP